MPYLRVSLTSKIFFVSLSLLAGLGCGKKSDRGVPPRPQAAQAVAPLPTIAPFQRPDTSSAPEQDDKKADDKGSSGAGWGTGSGRLTHLPDVKLYVQAQAVAVEGAKAKVEMLQKHAEEVKELLALKKGSLSPAAYKHWKGSRRRLRKAQGPAL